jgi:hypothetical protein
VFDGLGFAVLAVRAVQIIGGAVTEDAVLQRPDHVDGHPVPEALLADDDLLLQELVGDQVLRPADDAGYGTLQVGARADRTL